MLRMKYLRIEPDPIFIPVSVRGPEDLLKFKRLRQEKKYEVALNRAYVFRAIRPSVQTRVREAEVWQREYWDTVDPVFRPIANSSVQGTFSK